MNRRHLFSIIPAAVLRSQTAPSNKLNLALIGVWGRGTAHYNVMRNENVVALCDVNDLRTKEALEIFPKAKTYTDWRRCLDQKGIDGVIICTADHHHAFIANWALNRDMHVYCEKPLGISVEETRVVRANYLKKRAKLATQHGTQRHAHPNFERLRELVMDGAIGDLKRVHSWDSRQLPRPGYPEAEGQPPASLHYEQWIGPSPYHPYSPQYFGGSSGLNCLFWNMYRDFGVGQMGDMGAHTMDLVWNVIDAGAPSTIDIDRNVSDKYHPDICPVKLKAHFEHPANAWRGPIEVVWYQGGLKPDNPRNFIDVSKIGNGAIFEGTKGAILADFTTRMILPATEGGDLSYYKPRESSRLGVGVPLVAGASTPRVTGSRRSAALAPGMTAAPNATPLANGFPAVQLIDGKVPAGLGLPNTTVEIIASAEKQGQTPYRSSGDAFQWEWIDACKGQLNSVKHGTSTKTNCDFDYAGTMMEQMLLGLVAHRAGKKLEYDAVNGRVTNSSEANDYLKRTYRPNWTLNG